ncbi:hypothetical protein BASA81_004035 [Batrachochytrium salamandrivorans]|nr:hypothetical protein BASA81_004035 [Batrachochytrium salamandrivorans]
MAKLRFVGLCGVDESFTPPPGVEWPALVEWGVLFRRELQGKRSRFPSIKWIEMFAQEHAGGNLAAHLCSHDLEQVLLEGDFGFVRYLFEKLNFRRFQLNATRANGVDMDRINAAPAAELVGRITALAQALPSAEFILQRNPETARICLEMERSGWRENISFLFDSSVGTGVEITAFGRPGLPQARFGYAGGINPDNVARVWENISNSLRDCGEDMKVWIDMESGIRNPGDDSCSWEKCLQVARIANTF